MTQAITDTRPQTDAARVAETPALRVDGAHPYGDARRPESADASASLDSLPALPVELSLEAAEQLRREAQQLAAHLVERQRELDHREAQLHADAAARDAEFARARLLVDERERSLLAREQAHSSREAELAARENGLRKQDSETRRERVEAEFYLRREEEQLELRESQVALVEERLANEQRVVRQWEKELKDSKERFRRATHRIQQRHERRRMQFEHDSQLQLEALERRRAAIEQGVVGCDAEPAAPEELEQLRTVLRMELLAVRRLLDEQEQGIESLERERASFAAEQAMKLVQLAEQEADLASSASAIDARRAAVDHAEAELSAEHQQVLRERLALEELWARFANREDIELHRPRLAEIEAKLVEQFAAAERRLAERTDELESLREALVAEHAGLARQQTALETWKGNAEREFADKTRALTRREEELSARAARHKREEVDTRLKRLNR